MPVSNGSGPPRVITWRIQLMELFDAYQAPRDEVRDEIKEEILAPAVKGRKVLCG
jgi:hypothetical protein